VRGGWLKSFGALVALAGAALPACDDATPVQRGFGSRQILQLRDSTFGFYYAAGDLVYYATGYTSRLPPAQQPPPHFWSMNLATGETTDFGGTMPDVTAASSPSSAPAARYHCSEVIYTDDDRKNVLTIADRQTGVRTAITGVVSTSPICPTDGDAPFRAWRHESDGSYSLWTGRYDELQRTPLPVAVRRLLWRETDRTLVAAPSAAAPEELSVYAIPDADPSVATEIVPAALGSSAWAAGAAASTPLASSGLADPGFFWPATSGQTYTYERAMTDGSTVMFAGPYAGAAAREQALFPVAAGDGTALLRIEPYNYRTDGKWPQTTTWSSRPSGASTSTFRIWRDTSERLATCAWPGQRRPVGRADPAGENALFVNKQDCCSLAPDSALLLMVPNTDDGNPCRMLASDDVSTADFSPDGTAMFWMVEPSTGNPALWTAARDGTGARKIGDGIIADLFDSVSAAPRFLGDSRLEFTLARDLVWVDVHDDTNRTHFITSRTFGATIDLGPWLVTGHDYSEQDGNGTLALVNRESGETHTISPAVYTYTTPDLPTYGTGRLFQDDGSPIRILYFVRGRNPSPQDGLWIATITAQDRP
jgi:hypothetical protein